MSTSTRLTPTALTNGLRSRLSGGHFVLMGSPTQPLTEVRSEPIDSEHCSMRQPAARCRRCHSRASVKKLGLSSVTLAATTISCRCTVMKKQYRGYLYDWLSARMLSSILSLRSAIALKKKSSRNRRAFHRCIMRYSRAARAAAFVCCTVKVGGKVGHGVFNVRGGIIYAFNHASPAGSS